MPRSTQPSVFPWSEEALGMVASRFKALSEPTRLKIRSNLIGGEKTVNELAHTTKQGQPNVSKHLSLLFESGVVSKRREGLHIYYRIADDAVVALIQSTHTSVAKQVLAQSKAFE